MNYGRNVGFRCEYRAVWPLFVSETVHVWGGQTQGRRGGGSSGHDAELFATDDAGHVCMRANIRVHDDNDPGAQQRQ